MYLHSYHCCCSLVAKQLLLFKQTLLSDSFVTPWTGALQDPQAGILEWVAFPFPEGLPNPETKPKAPVLAGGFFTTGPP